MDDIYIIGVGMTPFGKHAALSVKDLTRQAVAAALQDAGAFRENIGAAYFGNAGPGAPALRPSR